MGLLRRTSARRTSAPQQGKVDFALGRLSTRVIGSLFKSWGLEEGGRTGSRRWRPLVDGRRAGDRCSWKAFGGEGGPMTTGLEIRGLAAARGRRQAWAGLLAEVFTKERIQTGSGYGGWSANIKTNVRC